MKFFIDSLSSYSEKSNKALIRFIDTNTILDECGINIFIPKSIEVTPGEVADLPFFICEGIWTSFLRSKHIKNLESQVKAKAPKGKKLELKRQTASIFDSLRAMNIKEEIPEKEETGQFVGKIGDKVVLILTINKVLFSAVWQDSLRWGQPHGISKTWQLSDDEGNIFLFKNSGKTNNEIDDAFYKGQKILITAKIIEQYVFRGVKQNKLINLRIKMKI